MINVNEKNIEWFEGITFSDILKTLGYTISNPRVIIRVDGEPVPRNNRDEFRIRDGMEIRIINTLCGG